MRSKAWLAARVSLRLAHLRRAASSAQRSRRLRSTRAAVSGLLAHTEVTKKPIKNSMGPKLRYPHGTTQQPYLSRACYAHQLTCLANVSVTRVYKLCTRHNPCVLQLHCVAVYGQLLLFCDQSMREKAWRSRKRGA